MQKLAKILWQEPVVILGITTGVTGVLAEQHLIAGWVPLVVLAVVTPIQRSLVTPTAKVAKGIMRKVKHG